MSWSTSGKVLIRLHKELNLSKNLKLVRIWKVLQNIPQSNALNTKESIDYRLQTSTTVALNSWSIL